MIIAGSLITIEENSYDEVLEALQAYPEVEFYTASEDGRSLVVVITTENDHTLDDLCQQIKTHPQVLDVSHHYFHFEEEVEEIRATGKKPDLSGFGKRRRVGSADA
ncbi:chaperone NapD [Geoalkalibacter subterraneus]|jgi:nitrate reductase NapD|uniref:Chaperone NapD n=1 Tax=Geoalkalibacter subterraneus TaxID=483547 RepID=A0A0B5FBM0_9BACT|nr:chaperone NapD [Geoalkalibacter subterraneus]AJF05542.1 hypothetical protein GSUB_01660 [Geoalkalibacter subterraneus]